MTIKSDGSTASYYELPQGATELQDLISYRNMNAQIGEILRACYRYGQASHSDCLRDAKKILFYAQAEVKRLEAIDVHRHPEAPNELQFDEDRMDVIGTNGNDGLHYDELDPILPCGKRWSEAPEWASKLAKLKSHDDFYWIEKFKVKSRCKCVDADLTYVLDQADIDALFVVSERPSAKG